MANREESFRFGDLRELSKISNYPNAMFDLVIHLLSGNLSLEALLSAADYFQLITTEPQLSLYNLINRNEPHLSLSLQEVQSSLS